MVWFPVTDSDRPPRWLGSLWVKLLNSSFHSLSPIIGVVHLFARLDELDVSFCDDAAVCLLEILENLLIIKAQDIGFPNRDRGDLVWS
jgi:hypothetical protein